MYKKIFTFSLALICSFLTARCEACKCVGPYKDAEDMYRQADVVFYGRKVLPLADNTIDTFEITRLAKSKIPLGSAKITTDKGPDWNAMCGGHYEADHDYLVFIKINPVDKTLQTMDECYSDVVSTDVKGYHYRNQDFEDFSFFKVNPLSAVNGVQPLYADGLDETQVKEIAIKEDREWRRSNGDLLSLSDTFQATEIARKQDEHGQSYWSVRVSPSNQQAKGDFQIINIYNTSSEGIIVYAGK